MKMPVKDNIYPEGGFVYAHKAPTIQLMVRKYVNRTYFCRVVKDPASKDLIYFEREITNQALPA